jgi:hypothetical protein
VSRSYRRNRRKGDKAREEIELLEMREVKSGQKGVYSFFVATIEGYREVGEVWKEGCGSFVVELGVSHGVINPYRGFPEICAGGKKKSASVGRKHASSGHAELL